MEENSDIIEIQRTRDNLIEYLEYARSEEKLLEYQRNVPIAQVTVELIEMWVDSFDMDGYLKGWYSYPTYTSDELQSALAFNSMIDYANEHLPSKTDDINNVFKMAWWPIFKEQANKTLLVFMKRGRLLNETEELNK